MQNRASAEQIELATQLLKSEGSGPGARESALAASHVHAKLLAHLGPLVGIAGVQALLARSAKLIEDDFAFLNPHAVEDAAYLQECLEALEPAIAAEAAVRLFATFFALTTTFIGQRLTMQALRSGWPMIRDTETNQ